MTFQNALADAPQPTMTVDNLGATQGTAATTTIGVNPFQQVGEDTTHPIEVQVSYSLPQGRWARRTTSFSSSLRRM